MNTKIASFILFALTLLAVSGTAIAGDVRGPREAFNRLPALSSHSYEFVFRGGDRWSIRVSGDGDTDLDCYVFDGSSHLVASDEDGTDECVLTDVPRWTGSFTLRITNRGRVYNDYHMWTN